jgi:hypothetical protein
MKLCPILSRPLDHSDRRLFVWINFKKTTRYHLSHLSTNFDTTKPQNSLFIRTAIRIQIPERKPFEPLFEPSAEPASCRHRLHRRPESPMPQLLAAKENPLSPPPSAETTSCHHRLCQRHESLTISNLILKIVNRKSPIPHSPLTMIHDP